MDASEHISPCFYTFYARPQLQRIGSDNPVAIDGIFASEGEELSEKNNSNNLGLLIEGSDGSSRSDQVSDEELQIKCEFFFMGVRLLKSADRSILTSVSPTNAYVQFKSSVGL